MILYINLGRRGRIAIVAQSFVAMWAEALPSLPSCAGQGEESQQALPQLQKDGESTVYAQSRRSS